MKKLGSQTKTSEVSLFNWVQEMEERISGIQEQIAERDILVKENVKIFKNRDIKC